MQAARRLLVAETDGTMSSATIAAGAAAACEKLSHRLAPLVGEAGVHSLFARSLALSRAKFPWFATVVITAPNASWTHLRLCIEQQPDEVAIEASVFLLAAFTGLLEKIIGLSLTARLLHDLWPDAYPATSPKEPP